MSVELAYETAGELGRGVPVVLLHAFPLERTMWRSVAERLIGAGVPSILIDLPGLGESQVPEGVPDLAVSADAVAGVLDRLGVVRALVAGVSMGGYVALALARRHRSRLAGLALIDTKAAADTDAARADRERIAQAVLGAAGSRALAPMATSLLGATSLATRPAVVSLVTEMIGVAPAEGVAWSQRAMASRPDATGELAGLALPVAVLVGEQDGVTPPDSARELAEQLPDALLTVIPGAGHLTPVEAPDAVAAALIGLLVRIPGISVLPAGGSAPPG